MSPLKSLALAVALAIPAAVLSPAPGLAHHSFAMFDFGKSVVLKGQVKELQWANPHVILWVETTAEPGRPSEVWSAELTSPGNLGRRGWNKRTLKPGDKVEVEINPLRDGGKGGAFRSARLVETGQVITSYLRSQDDAANP